MKRFFYVPVLLLSAVMLHSQTINTYSHTANLAGENILRTSDGGFLMVGTEFCYTPGVIVIEGCTFAFEFVKTNLEGDTLWTKHVPYSTSAASNIQLFENSDGSFSMFYNENDIYQCSGIFVGLFGFKNPKYLKLSAQGQVMNELVYIDECELDLHGVVRLADGNFLMAATFRDPIFTDEIPEGRFIKLNENGDILQTTTVPGVRYYGGKFTRAGIDANYLAYLDENWVLNISLVKDDGSIAWNKVYDSLDAGTPKKFEALPNGDLLYFPYPIGPPLETPGQLIRFDSQGNLLWEKSYWLPYIASFLVHSSGTILLPSSVPHSETDHDVKITYCSADGDSLTSNEFPYPNAKENPVELVEIEGGKIAVFGDYNCCNLEDAIGPGDFFLLFNDGFTATSEPTNLTAIAKAYPNPAKGMTTIAIAPRQLAANAVAYITDLHGRHLASQKLNVNGTSTFDLTEFPSGLYFYAVKNEGRAIAIGKLFKH